MQLEPDFDLLMFAAKSFPFFSLNTVSYNRNAPIKNLSFTWTLLYCIFYTR